VNEPGPCEFRGANSAAKLIRGFEDKHRETLASQGDRRRQSVRPRTDDNGISTLGMRSKVIHAGKIYEKRGDMKAGRSFSSK